MTWGPPLIADQVQITPDTPTWPDVPGGYTPILLWAYNEFFGIGPSDTLTTISLTVTFPFQVGSSTWQTMLDNVASAVAYQAGARLVAYAIAEEPTEFIVIPNQICIPGLPCIDVPGQIQVPPGCTCGAFPCFCIPLGGATLASGFNYQLWMLLDQPGGSSYRLRAQIPTIIYVLLAILGPELIPQLLAGIRGVLTGQVTYQDTTTALRDVLHVPGDNLTGPLQNVSLPLLAGSIVAAVAAVLIATQTGKAPPAVSGPAVSGSVNVPGGFGVSGSVRP